MSKKKYPNMTREALEDSLEFVQENYPSIFHDIIVYRTKKYAAEIMAEIRDESETN